MTAFPAHDFCCIVADITS